MEPATSGRARSAAHNGAPDRHLEPLQGPRHQGGRRGRPFQREIAAAYAAGGLSLEQAVVSAYYRGYVTTRQTRSGAMAAVGLGEADVLPFLAAVPGVVVACENSPNSTTISGDSEQVDKVIVAIKESSPDVLARKLKVDMAYHSRMHPALWFPFFLSFPL